MGGDVMCKAMSASISISLLVFLGILAHHGYLWVGTTRHYLLRETQYLNTCTPTRRPGV